MNEARGKRVAILVDEQYQDLEVWYPFYRLREAGVRVMLVGTSAAIDYRGRYGYPARVEKRVEEVQARLFDGILVPGGFAPDFMRRNPKSVEFVRAAHDAGKVIASICHGPWVLISAGIVRGRRMTCFSAIKDDVVNAGAAYTDEAVVIDGNIITSRKPDDLPEFCLRLIEALARGPDAQGAHPA